MHGEACQENSHLLHKATTQGKHATPAEKALRSTCRQQRFPAVMHLAGPPEPCSSPCDRLDRSPDPEIGCSSQSVTGHSFAESSLVTPVGDSCFILVLMSLEAFSNFNPIAWLLAAFGLHKCTGSSVAHTFKHLES